MNIEALKRAIENKSIDPVTAMFIFNAVLAQLVELWRMFREILGKENIPEWSDILAANAALQEKIDAEKR
jgi:hypothetical protein